MGRTIPSFRITSVGEQKEWKTFSQSLDKKDRKTFDNMFSTAHLYNSACSFAAKPIRIYSGEEPLTSSYFNSILGELEEDYTT